MLSVAYCRVSTDRDDQLNSLDNQISHYTELFQKSGFQGAQCGMYYSREGKKETIRHLTSIFADEGISGTKLKNREAFKYMLECAYRKEFDIIYIKNIQRFARNVEDGAGILKRLKVIGIKVVFEDGNLNNFEHEMIINVFLSTAQEESRAKSIAVQFGLRKAQEQGKFTPGTPYGYKTVNGYLKQIPEQTEVIKQIFNLYSKGWGSTKISKFLNEQNIPTQKGKRWAQSQIYDIITNEIYIGKQRQHTIINTDVNVDKTSYNDGNKTYKHSSKKLVDEGEWIVKQIDELRVVSDELFSYVQDENDKRKKLYGQDTRHSIKNIFSNLLYCRHCSKAMRRKTLWGWKRKDGSRNFGIEWVCNNHDSFHNQVCKFRNSWHEDTLINRVRSEIEKIKSDKSVLYEMYSDYVKLYLSAGEIDNKILECNQKLSEIKTEISANLKLYSKNIIDEEQYKQQNDQLQANRKITETELYKFTKINETRESAKKKFNNYIEYLDHLNMDNIDNIILKILINKIEAYTYYDDNKEIKDIYIVWNILDKSFDDIFYKKANIPIV